MKNTPIPTSPNSPSGFRGFLNHLLGRSGEAAAVRTKVVKVWDSRCDSYRNVDLYDRNDPLWPTARELYLISKNRTGKTAA